MRVKTMGLWLVSFALSFSVPTAVPAEEDLHDLVASTSASNCEGIYCATAQGKGTGILDGGNLEAAYACSVHVAIQEGPAPTTAPVAAQVTECYMTTGFPSQTPSVGRTLPGLTAAAAGHHTLTEFASPIRMCVAGKIYLENNVELRVPATGVECTPPDEVVVATTASNCDGALCAVLEAAGSGVIVAGALETTFSCSVHASAQGGPPPGTVPVAAQVTECYMTTAYPSQTPSVGRTLPGEASGAQGRFSLSSFDGPNGVCASGKLFLEDNREIRVPASGVACTTP